MGAAALPVILFTLIWAGVAGSGYFVPVGPHQRLIQVGSDWSMVLILTYWSGVSGHDGGVLLAVVALLLHVSDESFNRFNVLTNLYVFIEQSHRRSGA